MPKNVTGTESREFDREELMSLAEDADSRGAPEWVISALYLQATEGMD